MVNISNYISYNSLAMALAICSFTPVAALPQQQSIHCANIEDAVFGVRVIKLAEKGKSLREKMSENQKLNNKNSNKLLDIMFDLKDEITSYTGTNINIDDQIDQIFYNMKVQGIKVTFK